ncbi:MAG: cysteine desulfurase [Alphaproteobacteria bacterium]
MNKPVAVETAPVSAYDVEAIRADFPILAREVYGKPLVYLDNGASAQKPQAVIDAISNTYSNEYANVHRGLHFLSNAATDAYEKAREIVRGFLNAPSVDEIIFTRSATEAINLVAASFGGMVLGAGDEIVLSIMEHHSNIVPWHYHRARSGAKLVWVDVADDGSFDLEAFEAALTDRTKIVAITHMSNVLGTVVPIAEVCRIAHARDAMPPYMGGGEMILDVTMDDVTYNDPPHRFEAGTPPIVQAIGLGAALTYMESIGRDAIAAHEAGLAAYAHERLSALNSVRIFGTAPGKGAIVSFEMEGLHAHDISMIIDREGVAVRAGTHCAQPLLSRFGVTSTCRASFGLYNTRAEVDALANALVKAHSFLT